jgi:putative transposase
MFPPCFPPVWTVRRWFYLWRDNRLSLSLNHALLLTAREGTGREASPSAGVIDTEGNLVHALIHTADILDRDGAPLVLAEIIRRFPWMRNLFADGCNASGKPRDSLRRIGKWTVEIGKGFVVLPCRWVVETTLTWLNHNRRLAKHFEQTIGSANSMVVQGFYPALRVRIARL